MMIGTREDDRIVLEHTLQFAGSHLLTSLLAFNVGVEIGQLFVLLVTIPALALLFRYVVAERMGTILLSALVAHTAWHWAIDRGTTLMGYRFPEFTLQDMAAGIRLLMVILAAAGAVWLISSWIGRASSEPSRALAPEPEPSVRSASDPLIR